MIYLRVVATSTGRLRYSLTRSTISLRVSSVRRVKMKNQSCLRWAGLTPRVIADRTVVFCVYSRNVKNDNRFQSVLGCNRLLAN